MASAEKLPSGRWRGIYYDSAGTKQRIKGTFRTKTAARDAAQEAEVKAKRQASRNAGTLSARITWGEWWELLSEERAKRPTATHPIEKNMANKHILPRWGKVPLNRITHDDLQRWVTRELSEGRAPAYVRRIWGIMSVSLSAAVADGVLTANPASGIKLPKVRRTAKKFVTEKKVEATKPRLSPLLADAIEFMFRTGLRPGELAGIHVSQIDFDGGWLSVDYVYVTRKQLIRPWPKDQEVRKVPLTPSAMRIIERRLEGRTDLDDGCGIEHFGESRKCRSALVFKPPRAKALRSDTFWKLLNQRGLDVTPYQCRRGFATHVGKTGDPFLLQRLLGHSTLDQSAQYVQSDGDRERLLAAFGEAPRLRPVDPLPESDSGNDEDGREGASARAV